VEILAKFGIQQTFYFTMVDAGTQDLAVTGDWTPAATDANIIIDGGATAQCTNTIAFEDDVIWSLTLTAAEMQGTRIAVSIVDSATKAVEDNVLIINTQFSGQIQANQSIYIISVDDGTFTPTTSACEFTMISPHLVEETTADQFIGRLLYGTTGIHQAAATDITDYVLANSKLKLTYTVLKDGQIPVAGELWVIV